MRRASFAAVAALMVCASGALAAQTTNPSTSKPAPAPTRAGGSASAAATAAPRGLAGTWRSATYTRSLDTDFDKSVWGPNAVATRDVELVIRTGGAATLTVTSKVLDAKKRTVPGSASTEVAQLVVGDPLPTVGVRTDHVVKVTSAERRYPDDPKGTWPIEGLKVQITTLTDEPGLIDFRFDTPEGRGSFWEALRRRPAK